MSRLTCRLCGNALEDSAYCKMHRSALFEIQKKYADWVHAYDGIAWERYLETILGIVETGDLVKAVAAEELRRYKSNNRVNSSQSN
jgi:hypothetical protein